MKQKTIALCCIVIAVFSCCIGCMNKSDCVPDSVVLFDFQEEINRIEYQVDHRIEHNPDSASHTDAATLLLEYETEYTKESGTIDCLYQYMRSDDLWELKDYQDCVWSTELKSFFTDTAPHRGSDGETNYALYIDDIDTEKMTITACYIIKYDGKGYPQYDSVTFDLNYDSGSGYYYFKIDLPVKHWSGEPVTATFTLGSHGINFWCV